MSEQRDNSGALFRNDRKEQPTHADHRGSCMIDGREYWISAWIKEGKNGRFFSLAFKPKETEQAAAERRVVETAKEHFGDGVEVRERSRPSGIPKGNWDAKLNDEIPF